MDARAHQHVQHCPWFQYYSTHMHQDEFLNPSITHPPHLSPPPACVFYLPQTHPTAPPTLPYSHCRLRSRDQNHPPCESDPDDGVERHKPSTRTVGTWPRPAPPSSAPLPACAGAPRCGAAPLGRYQSPLYGRGPCADTSLRVTHHVYTAQSCRTAGLHTNSQHASTSQTTHFLHIHGLTQSTAPGSLAVGSH